jgi:hypothetical protein
MVGCAPASGLSGDSTGRTDRELPIKRAANVVLAAHLSQPDRRFSARSLGTALHNNAQMNDRFLHIGWRSFIARPTKAHALNVQVSTLAQAAFSERRTVSSRKERKKSFSHPMHLRR